jgi:hypothetical protein
MLLFLVLIFLFILPIDNDIELLDYISVSSEDTMDPQSRQILENKKRAEIEPEIILNSSFPNIVVRTLVFPYFFNPLFKMILFFLVTGIPSVHQDKFEKLKNALSKRIFVEMQQKGVFNSIEDKEKSGKHTYPFQIYIPQVMKDGSLVTQKYFTYFISAHSNKKIMYVVVFVSSPLNQLSMLKRQFPV